MGGEDEMEMIKDLPQGLRRDIKRYLCLDLVKKVNKIVIYQRVFLNFGKDTLCLVQSNKEMV